MVGCYRIPVNSKIYKLVKSYSIKSKLTLSEVSDILYRLNINVYDSDKVLVLLKQYKQNKYKKYKK